MRDLSVMDRLLSQVEQNIKSTEEQKREIAVQLNCAPEDIQVRLDHAANRMAEQGIILDLCISRKRFEINIEPEDLGITKTEWNLEYLKEYVILGRRRLVPKEYTDKLSALENKARKSLRDNSFQTAWGYFVPLSNYQELRSELDDCKAEYIALNENIIIDYDGIANRLLWAYRDAAYEVYKSLNKDEYAVAPEDFINNFVDKVLQKLPTVSQIRDACKFEVNLSMVPLSMSSVKQFEARMDAQVWREAQAMVAEDIRQSYCRNIEGFVSDIAVQLRSMIYDAVAAVQDNINKNGVILGPNIMALKNLMERVAGLNFMNDQEVIQQVRELASIVDQAPKDRNIDEISKVLSSLEEENRATLLALGHKPRARRNLAEENNEGQVFEFSQRRPRRNGNLAYEAPDEQESEGGARRKRGLLRSL